jgi:hypothetical protein
LEEVLDEDFDEDFKEELSFFLENFFFFSSSESQLLKFLPLKLLPLALTSASHIRQSEMKCPGFLHLKHVCFPEDFDLDEDFDLLPEFFFGN